MNLFWYFIDLNPHAKIKKKKKKQTNFTYKKKNRSWKYESETHYFLIFGLSYIYKYLLLISGHV